MTGWTNSITFPFGWPRDDLSMRIGEYWTGIGLKPTKSAAGQLEFKGACGKRTVGVTVRVLLQLLPQETILKLDFQPTFFYQMFGDTEDAMDFKASIDQMMEGCKRFLNAWAEKRPADSQ